MSQYFQIPDIENVRSGQAFKEYTERKVIQPSLEQRVTEQINHVNRSIVDELYADYPMTCFEIDCVVLQHPKFQLYVEKLVQAGYKVRIPKSPATIVNII